MTRALVAAVLVLGFAFTASADVTLKQTVEGKGMGMAAKMNTTTYIKGHKMRTETQMGDKTTVTVFDVDVQKMYMFEVGKKEADVWDMAAFSADVTKNVDVSNMQASVKPNGQTKQISGHAASGYDMEIVVPAAIGGNKDMVMTITMGGPIWMVKTGPGVAEYAAFYKAAAEKGWIFSDPRAAKAQPGQARATTEMHKQFAAIGGIPYESDWSFKMGGSGPMAGLMAKMGNMSAHTTTDSVTAGPLADDLFAPPAGAKLNQKK